MNLSNKILSLSFIVGLLFTLLVPIFFSQPKINFFIPYLIILYYQKPFLTCLWGSLAVGLILDLVSPYARFGIYAAGLLFTTSLLYGQKRRFFADSFSTLPVMAFLFSLICTALHVMLLGIFEKASSLSFESLIIDFVFIPLCDAAFAFVFYILPFILFGKPVRKGKDYFQT